MTNPLLSPSASLCAGVTQTGQSVSATDAYVKQLLALPIPDGCLVASLPADVSQASTDARLWTSQYRPLAVSTLLGVVDFGDVFDNFYAELLPLANQIVAGDQGAIVQFNQLLQELQTATLAKVKLAQSVAQQLTSYDQVLDQDVAAINADQTELLTIEATQTSLAKAAQQEADALDREISQMQAQVALAYLQGHYVSASFMEMINQLSGRASALRMNEQLANSAAYTLAQQAQAASSEAANVQQYQHVLGTLQSGIAQLVNGWAAMDGNFAVLAQAEHIHSYGAWTPALLNAAWLDWNTLAAQAQSLLDALNNA